MNNDCAVNFVNFAEEGEQLALGIVYINWEEVGPVDFTDCRIEVGTGPGRMRGPYSPCKFIFRLPSLYST